MFEVTSCNSGEGVVVVEDAEFGLMYQFNDVNVKEAKVINDYDLLITRKDGTTNTVRILE
jgi:hypothetical protein